MWNSLRIKKLIHDNESKKNVKTRQFILHKLTIKHFYIFVYI